MTAAFPVQQAAEDRFGVEAGKAQPVDAAIQADQGHGRPVSDQPQILKGRIAVAGLGGPERGIRLEHDVDGPPPVSAPQAQGSSREQDQPEQVPDVRGDERAPFDTGHPLAGQEHRDGDHRHDREEEQVGGDDPRR